MVSVAADLPTMILRYALVTACAATLLVGCRRDPAVQEVPRVVQSGPDTAPALKAVAYDSVAAAIDALEQRTEELEGRLEARDSALGELRRRIERLEAVRR